MKTVIAPNKDALGRKAARAGAQLIREAIASRGEGNIIVATGASQFEMLAALVREPDVAWHKVTAFHLDEYIGVPIAHPASFRKYLWERFHRLLPLPLRQFHYIDGESDPNRECQRVGGMIRELRVDVAFIGIGENGHLAFNDPPADFDTNEPYLIVDLDEACRRQQLGEGWFAALADVPSRAISMSCRQIMKSAHIICSVPDRRKAKAVRNALEGPVTPQVPASILQQYPDAAIYLDPDSASQMTR